ncbi:aldo/keto reductase [Clostridium sp. PL3]|uniref:Aldo/keto reductase n=1 Tax=Clostridium thailandense TaxID=2794346 RepID=A0A949U1K7_9CLOT|nr:aldo/keto reductase [Clostridium thailandense]MBV7275695.1 aldo/keto reductase [Clostridium thailandense]
MRMTNTTGCLNKSESIATIHAAIDAGIQLINTADFYSSGYNEMLIGEALNGHKRDKTFISVKFGGLSDPKGNYYGLDVRTLTIKNYITYSLKRLNVDYIDLYQPGRINLGIPVEETIGAISDLVKAGYVRHIGISEVDADTLRKANSVHPISFIESEYSLFNRRIETEILPTARELGIGAKKVSQIQDAIKAADITLSENEVKRIEAVIPESAIAGAAQPNGLLFKNGIMVR